MYELEGVEMRWRGGDEVSTSQSSSQANIRPHVMYEVEVYEVDV